MALTTGKKVTGVTGQSVSQQASRMGIVQATTADWVSMAAEAIGSTLDEEAKRKAILEENDYKSRFTIDTIKSMNDFHNANEKDPAAFTNSADAYIKKITNEAPFRFKNWAKQYASTLAFRHGQEIHSVHEAEKTLESMNLELQSQKISQTDMLRFLNSRPSAEWDSDFQNSILQEIVDKTGSYEIWYNGLLPKDQAKVDHPNIYKAKLGDLLEKQRIKNWVRDYYALARLKDQEAVLGVDLTGDNNVEERPPEHEGLTHLDIAEQEVGTMLTQYRNNPEAVFGGDWTLIDSTDARRLENIDDIHAYSDTNITSGERENEKNSAFINSRYETEVQKLRGFLESGESNDMFDEIKFDIKFPNIDKLNAYLLGLNAPEETIKEIKDLYNYKDNIEMVSKYLNSEGVTKRTITHNNVEHELDIFNNIWTDSIGAVRAQMAIDGNTLKVSDEDIKQSLINDAFYRATGTNLESAVFAMPVLTGENTPNPAMEFMAQFVANNGFVPKEFANYISTAHHLVIDDEESMNQLINIAHAVDYINNVNTVKDIAIDGLDNKLEIKLETFWDKYNMRKKILDSQVHAGTVIQEGTLTLNQFAKNWWNSHNERDNDRVDIINAEIHKKIIDLGLSDVMQSVLIESLENHKSSIWKSLKQTVGGYEYGVLSGEARMRPVIDLPIIDWLLQVPDDKALDIEESLAKEMFANLVPDYMLHYYNSILPANEGDYGKKMLEFHIQAFTADDFTNHMKDIMKYVINDISHMNIGVEK